MTRSFITSLNRKFIAGVLATAVAITGLGMAPAQAGDKDLKRLVLGVAALGIIAAAIENDKRRDHATVSRHTNYAYGNDRQRDVLPRVQPARPHTPHAKVTPRPLPDRARAAILPSECLRSVSDRRGTRNVYAARCLERNDVRVSRLPDACQLAVIGQRGNERTAFDAGCLANYGYRSGRR